MNKETAIRGLKKKMTKNESNIVTKLITML